ncbi:hypothetical protein ACFTSD_18970 [Nocardiaceae bacterium NPDC056970]
MGLWFLAIVSGGGALILAPASAGLAVVSALVTCIGGGLAVVATARTLRENRGRRLPWLGRPPVHPRRWDLLSGSGAPMVVFGAGVFGRTVGGSTTAVVLPLALGAALTIAMVTAQTLHNRRVAAG